MRESFSSKGALPFAPAGTKAIDTFAFWELVVTADSDRSAAAKLAQSSNAATNRYIAMLLSSLDARILQESY